MWIESVCEPVTYRWPGGTIRFVPGQPVKVNEERGAKILRRCGNEVRVVGPFNTQLAVALAVEGMVEFASPLFGMCTGRVLGLTVESVRIGEHSAIKDIVTIPHAWVTRVLETRS